MATEIERKFIVNRALWDHSTHYKLSPGYDIKQGYLTDDAVKQVRIRVIDKEAFITIKDVGTGKRFEFETRIPFLDAYELLNRFCNKVIEKRRFELHFAGRWWIVDFFQGLNDGLVLAEVELDKLDDHVEIPLWCTKEVTDDLRYYNGHLINHPYPEWKDQL